jgi:hypothetical protein
MKINYDEGQRTNAGLIAGWNDGCRCSAMPRQVTGDVALTCGTQASGIHHIRHPQDPAPGGVTAAITFE